MVAYHCSITNGKLKVISSRKVVKFLHQTQEVLQEVKIAYKEPCHKINDFKPFRKFQGLGRWITPSKIILRIPLHQYTILNKIYRHKNATRCFKPQFVSCTNIVHTPSAASHKHDYIQSKNLENRLHCLNITVEKLSWYTGATF